MVTLPSTAGTKVKLSPPDGKEHFVKDFVK